MKRLQISNTDEYIDWLKSIGCRFYTPLNQENETNELIQNWTFNVRSGCTCLWDDTKNAYFFDGGTDSYHAGYMYNGQSYMSENIGQYVRNLSYTIIADIWLTTDRNNGWGTVLSYGGRDDFYIYASGTSSTRNVASNIHKQNWINGGKTFPTNRFGTMCIIRNTQIVDRYEITENSLEHATHEEGPTFSLIYNSNIDTHLSIASAVAGYFKNIYVFTNALSDNQLFTIYNHDHE